MGANNDHGAERVAPASELEIGWLVRRNPEKASNWNQTATCGGNSVTHFSHVRVRLRKIRRASICVQSNIGCYLTAAVRDDARGRSLLTQLYSQVPGVTKKLVVTKPECELAAAQIPGLSPPRYRVSLSLCIYGKM